MKIKYTMKEKRRGKSVPITRTKNVNISGKIIGNPKRGKYLSQMGSYISGVKVTYEKTLAKGAGRGGRIKKRRYMKVISIPTSAYKVQIIR